MDLPLKSELLLSFKDKESMWEDEAFENFLQRKGITSKQWKWHCRFWLSELAAVGVLDIVDTDVYNDNQFAPGKLRCKYALNDYGRASIKSSLE